VVLILCLGLGRKRQPLAEEKEHMAVSLLPRKPQTKRLIMVSGSNPNKTPYESTGFEPIGKPLLITS